MLEITPDEWHKITQGDLLYTLGGEWEYEDPVAGIVTHVFKDQKGLLMLVGDVIMRLDCSNNFFLLWSVDGQYAEFVDSYEKIYHGEAECQ